MVAKNNNVLIGKVYIELDNVSSTNDYAKILLANSEPKEGTAIFACNQWKGKGQYGNQWVSEPGRNIILSIVLYPGQIALQRFFYLNIVASLAVRDMAAETLGDGVWVKWPNDIVYQPPGTVSPKRWQKLGGILVETFIERDHITTCVLGLGINVNQRDFEGATAGGASFQTITGSSYELQPLIHDLFDKLQKRYNLLLSGRYDHLKNEYLAYLLGWNQKRLYQDRNGRFQATLLNVEEDGQVHLLTDKGMCQYKFKEVELL